MKELYKNTAVQQRMSVCLIVILLMASAALHAQTISVSAPTEVSEGENFRLSYTIGVQDVSEFRAGNIPSGLEVIAGPYTSRQSSFQIVNGHTSSSASITYTYTLYAEKSGTYTIPAARAVVGGKTIQSKAVRVVVAKGAHQSGAPRMHGDESGEAQVRPAGSHISGSDLFVKVSANKQRVHEQEPILLTYKVYTLVDLTQLDGKMPDLTGFHTQEIPLPQQKSFHVEKVNGRNYRCVTWSQYVMYPQITGKLQIPSITFKGIVVQQNRAVDPFEAFFNGGSGYVEVKRDIVAPGLSIQVDPLPAKPADFSGGVGRFNISAQVTPNELKAGEPLTLRVIVSGVGNLKLIKQPVVTFPKDFDKYDPKVTDKTKLTNNGIEGSMIYEYLAVPRNQGDFQIPAIKLTYYDSSANAYKTVSTEPITIHVAKGDGKSGKIVDYSQTKTEDIKPLKTGDVRLHAMNDFFFGSATYLCILLTLIVVFLLLVIVFRKRAIENADLVKMKGRKANKIARKRLKIAYNLMTAGQQSEFYDEVLKALWGYVGSKLNMPVESLSRENIADTLLQHNVQQETVDKFIGALDECEFERYAPGDAAGNMNRTYTFAMNAIMDIEDAVRTSKHAPKTALLLILLLAFSAIQASATTKLQADSAYTKGNYQQAIAGYEQLLKTGVSADVYYNLGNAYYRSGDITQAVLAYERAHLLAPGDNDIRLNLQLASSKTIDKIAPESEMFFVTWYRAVVYAMSVDAWAWFAVALLVAGCLLVLVYLFAQSLTMRKLGFSGFAVCIVLFILSNVFAFQQKRALEQRNTAIVTASVVTVKNTPAESGADAFVIHEGTKITITDKTMKGWWSIRLADGREGWLRTSVAEEI